MFFQKNKLTPPSKPPSGSTAKTSAAKQSASRLVLERVEWMAVVGWAVQDGHAADVELWLGDQRLSVTPHRYERSDVAAALGLSGDERFGFSLDLPPSLLTAADSVPWPSLQVVCGSQHSPVPGSGEPVTAQLNEWTRRMMGGTTGDGSVLQWPHLVSWIAHAGGPGILAADPRRWIEEEAARWGDSAALSDPSIAPTRRALTKASIESMNDFVVQGWACSSNGETELIKLLCNGQDVDCGVVRLERDDVRQALGSDRLNLGFEVEIPGTIWGHASVTGVCDITLTANGQVVQHAPLHLDHGSVIAALARAQAEDQSRPVADSPHATADRQYRLLLALEHLAGSGVGPSLPAALASFANTQAARFGLSSLLVASPPAAVQNGLGVPAHDYTSILTWRLLRQFNEALTRDPLLALSQILSNPQVEGEARERFILAVIPFFCGIARYPALRPWIDAVQLRALADKPSRWESSLALPELAASGDLVATADLLQRIATQQLGWLNTECISESMRLVLQPVVRRPADSAAIERCVRGFRTLLDEMKGDYWSRLHDRHLIDGMVHLLHWSVRIPDGQSASIALDALRHYGLVPAFWAAWSQSIPDPQCWHPELTTAHQVFGEIKARLESTAPATLSTLWRVTTLLQFFRARLNKDADGFLRETVLRAAPLLPHAVGEDIAAAFATLCTMNHADALRLAAHPLAGTAAVVSAWPELSASIRSISGIPPYPAHRRLELACRALNGGPHPAGAAPHAELAAEGLVRIADDLTSVDARYMGVRLSVVNWLMARHQPGAGDFRLSAIREQFMRAMDLADAEALPPAALTSAFALLSRALSAVPDPGLAILCAEVGQRLAGRYGELSVAALPAAAQCALQDTHAPSSTLVVIYSCRKNLDTRVPLIRQTWGADLQRAGIPFVVLVGDGDDRLHGDVLHLACSDAYEGLPAKTLAMIAWVFRHTNFGYLLKIDDDCHLAVDRLFSAPVFHGHHYWGRRLHRAEGGTDRLWHRSKSASSRAAASIDKSPEPSIYADGGSGYSLSRYAMARVLDTLRRSEGARLTRSAYMEDKLLGDLLAQSGILLSNQGHESLVRRRFGDGTARVNAFQNVFYPSICSPTLLTHLDDPGYLPAVSEGAALAQLRPPRLWPSYAAPLLGGPAGTNQLELLSPPMRLQELAQSEVIVIAVARNESVLLPHFLDHYRRLGARQFILVDNLSDDGSREYLLEQEDVNLYSADTEYRHSHFGVAWQQAVLAAHGLGKWVVLADIDEFLIYPGCESIALGTWVEQLGSQGHDAAMTLMVDMYPEGALDSADFSRDRPFDAAPCFDRKPMIDWRMGSGFYSSGPTHLSALRHRLIENSAPNLYTSQKIAVVRYQPWIRFSEGLHYASNVTCAPERAYFAHFKYHSGFKRKVQQEIARKQHFNDAEEYKKYLDLVAESSRPLSDAALTARYVDSQSFASIR